MSNKVFIAKVRSLIYAVLSHKPLSQITGSSLIAETQNGRNMLQAYYTVLGISPKIKCILLLQNIIFSHMQLYKLYA